MWRKHAAKARFNPDQPRVPAGDPDGGQWTSGEGDTSGGTSVGGFLVGAESADGETPATDFDLGALFSDASALGEAQEFSAEADGNPFPSSDPDDGQVILAAGIGHNQGPPLEPPPIPQQPPATPQLRTAFIKSASQWIARALRTGGPVGAFLGAMEAASWLDTDRPFIESYQDAPRTLEELQAGASERKIGYQRHHVVEQTSAEKDGFARDLIDGSDNLVRIPTLKHWEITGWNAKPNIDYGMQSPRNYLRGKGW